ncbi:MAG: tRNA lysidine(34) synthetase TilS [Bacteroidaceae bacterium]|nr:tRNA lysidine(34) synthetase TilS [Bacteroidaceae bacterium]
MKSNLLQAWEENVEKSGKILVAVSGGADSVALLLSLHQAGYDSEALHCNFALRGLESDRDELFVRHLCRTNNIALSVKHFHTEAYARQHHVSIEMAARTLRYEWFEEMRQKRGAVAIAVGHHKDDQAETLLLNLIRGTGLRGLCGMSSHLAHIVRPLLGVSRSEIEEWLTAQGQDWIVDSTNLQADAAIRNRIRLEIIPALGQINPSVVNTLVDTSGRMREALKLYEKALASERTLIETGNSIDIQALKNSIAPQTIFHEILHERGFTTEQAEDIFRHLDGEPGHEWRSDKWRLLRDRGHLLWQRIDEEFTLAQQLLPLEGQVQITPSTKLIIRRQPRRADTQVSRHPLIATFDLEKLTLPLTVRSVRPHDRMKPFGMTGTRLLSDIMTDLKMSLFDKERQLVVLSGSDIVWLTGRRAAAGFEVDEKTRFILTLQLVLS